MNIPLAIPVKDLHLHKEAIQRQAIEFYKLPNMFGGEPKFQRWKQCVRLVADTWMRLGPQSFVSGPVICLLPPSF